MKESEASGEKLILMQQRLGSALDVLALGEKAMRTLNTHRRSLTWKQRQNKIMILGEKDDDVERLQVCSLEKKETRSERKACSFSQLEVEEETCQERE